MNRDIYSIKQYYFSPSLWTRDQPGEISSKKSIKEKHIERHKDAFITQLDVNHMPTEVQKKYLTELFDSLKNTDSIKQAAQIVDSIATHLKEMQENIEDMRKLYFKVINEYSVGAYGVLAKGFTEQDRDNYIKALVHYSGTLSELNAFFDKFALKLPSLDHSPQIDADLKALENLTQDRLATLPDFTYNSNLITL